MIIRILTGSIVALGLGLVAETARADQTFVCEDGRMVQVSLGDLERLKREDPCIAAYYGRKLARVPLPVRRPAEVRGPVLKGAQQAAAPVGAIGTMAARPTDDRPAGYRHVRIINAAPGSAGIYSHTR